MNVTTYQPKNSSHGIGCQTASGREGAGYTMRVVSWHWDGTNWTIMQPGTQTALLQARQRRTDQACCSVSPVLVQAMHHLSVALQS